MIHSKQRVVSTVFIFFLSCSSNVLGDEHRLGIQYLLKSIEDSDCIFVRNGDEHTAKAAAEHLAYKYQKVKKRIKSAEQFIDKIATKSFLTGEAYTIECDEEQPIETGIWLHEKLKEYVD